MEIDFKKMGLVLEGGGMRGVFTCGVLDYLMDRRIEFPYAVGVSAGACNGLSYMSHQRGRAKYSNIDLLEKYHYIGLKYFWNQHSILDQHLLYELFPDEILPYDYQAYYNNPARFEMVTTNCVTGKACYLEEKADKTRLIAIVKASAFSGFGDTTVGKLPSFTICSGTQCTFSKPHIWSERGISIMPVPCNGV